VATFFPHFRNHLERHTGKSTDFSRPATSESQETARAREFQHFLEAVDNLGSRLTTCISNDASETVPLWGEGSVAGQTPNSDSAQASSGSVTPIGPALLLKQGKKALSAKPVDQTAPISRALDGSLIVRLHFAEAMMVLLFNSLDEMRQSSIKEGFGRLLAEVDNLEISGASTETLRAYRDALSAMQNMLASNPEPKELAVALRGDFVKRHGR
jgi:hypothetical protein